MLKTEELIANGEVGKHFHLLYKVISGTDNYGEKVSNRSSFEILVYAFIAVGLILLLALVFTFFNKDPSMGLVVALKTCLIIFGFGGLALVTIHHIEFGKHLHACKEIERRVSVLLKEDVDIPGGFFRCKTEELMQIATGDLVQLARSELEWHTRLDEEKIPAEKDTVRQVFLKKKKKFDERYDIFHALLLTPLTHEIYYKKAREEISQKEGVVL